MKSIGYESDFYFEMYINLDKIIKVVTILLDLSSETEEKIQEDIEDYIGEITEEISDDLRYNLGQIL